MSKKIRIQIISLVGLLAIIGVFCLSPIPQGNQYHDFADKRAFLNISNFGDVISNIPFSIFGIMGLVLISQRHNKKNMFIMNGERMLWKTLFVGIFLVGFGSGYYHLNPNNHSLVWDRLPMTIAFLSFFTMVIMERINERLGLIAFPFLLMLGVASIVYWDYTETIGRGDLRPYVIVQFLPIILTPLIFWLLPGKYNGTGYLLYVIGWYFLAKVLEHFDDQIFALTKQILSGHSLKHLAASISAYMLIVYLKKRRIS